MAQRSLTDCPVQMSISSRLSNDDPQVEIYNARLETDSELWTESFGSQDQVRAFIRGVRAAAALLGHNIPEPEVPRPR